MVKTKEIGDIAIMQMFCLRYFVEWIAKKKKYEYAVVFALAKKKKESEIRKSLLSYFVVEPGLMWEIPELVVRVTMFWIFFLLLFFIMWWIIFLFRNTSLSFPLGV